MPFNDGNSVVTWNILMRKKIGVHILTQSVTICTPKSQLVSKLCHNFVYWWFYRYNIIPLDDMTSFWLFNIEKEITTKFVSLVILAPSPDNLICSLSSGSEMSMIFLRIYIKNKKCSIISEMQKLD